jgi:glutamate N-acetyltransferase/amino-acid N-acetyltransferase
MTMSQANAEPSFETFDGHVTSPLGYRAAGVRSGVKKDRLDLALLASDQPATVAGVFTRNQVQAACVHYCREVVAAGQARAVVINSGNANACTGERGVRDNLALAECAARALGTEASRILVASTGVIGVPLQLDKVTAGIEQAVAALTAEGGAEAARAIMTTDTVPKQLAMRVPVAGGTAVTLGGIAKGSGMIEPDMATTLGFVTTDAAIAAPLLQQLLSASIDKSFNCITVDGDTSTNDTVLLLANGASGQTIDETTAGGTALDGFAAALDALTLELALKVVRDGEGATKLMQVDVMGARNDDQARKVAKTVANSPLIKTALHGSEPNWGRILMAVGRSPAEVVESRISVWYGPTQIVKGGLGILDDLTPLAEAMAQSDVELRIDLGIGNGEARVFTCDLSAEYVRINGSYIS